ncbi:Hexose carrier protein HEX6 [Dichanthelium oligosanthes]|uniref:Hexose carrier protein HEX6 n=1 Tax=Dichanthelium oligosanthes TaxID=888268 RepID=A0A1E5V704_9POAL|nr:Hexose carrier protein HEX6 [Dichanthelium oligosanthes]
MAVGVVAVEGQERHYSGRITAFVVLSCMTAGMGGVIFGYDIGIAGGVSSMEPFLRKFFPDVYRRMRGDTRVSNYCKFDSQLLTAFTSSLYVAGLLTTFLAARVTAGRGRRASMVLGGAAFLAGAAVGGASVNIYMVILGRVLLGVGLGFANQAVPLYLSEMAPARFRGAFSNGFQLSVGIGALAANLINFGTEKIRGGWGWRVSLALAGVPAGLLTLGALFLPETPNSLVQQGKDREDVARLLQKIRGADVDVGDELDDIVAANGAAAATGEGDGLRMILFERQYRPQLVMAVMIPFFQQVTGINAIAFYAPVLLRTIGMGESASLLSAVVTGVVGVGATFASMLAVDRFGRRTLFLAGGAQMLASQVLIGAILAAELRDSGGVSKAWAGVLILLIAVYVAGFGWSWGPLGWLVPSEIFPLEVRAAGQGVTVAVSFAFTVFVAQAFLSMLCHMRAGIFFFFAAWLAVMTAFVYFLLPETKGVPIEQVAGVWRAHWFWSRVVGPELDDARSGGGKL